MTQITAPYPSCPKCGFWIPRSTALPTPILYEWYNVKYERCLDREQLGGVLIIGDWKWQRPM